MTEQRIAGRKVRRDIWWGAEGIERLDRLSEQEGRPGGEIAREALTEYELNRATLRDAVRNATLNLVDALLPDERYDPVDDPRQDEAVRALAALLDSVYAAQGIAQAIQLLQTQQFAAQEEDSHADV